MAAKLVQHKASQKALEGIANCAVSSAGLKLKKKKD